MKRSLRDPYGDWWDKQERRNWGEPVHEDNDILGVFSLEEYRHFKPPMAFFLVGCVIASVLGVAGAVSFIYPDVPAAPRTFEDGLEAELGGPGAVRVRLDLVRCLVWRLIGRTGTQAWRIVGRYQKPGQASSFVRGALLGVYVHRSFS